MKLAEQYQITVPGPVGQLAVITFAPTQKPYRGIALIAHPNPLQGGTNTNKVVQTLAKTFVKLGYLAVCPNLRGVGTSEGEHDYGIGETEDMLAVAEYTQREVGDLPVVLAGFSFGAFVQSRVAKRIACERLVLVGPAVSRFAVETVPANTLVIHGEEDEVIPLNAVFDWARPQQLPIVVVPGVGHFFHGRLHQLQEIVLGAWHR